MATKHEPTFFFYDLETSGLSARNQRIMQFAGQRTDMALQPVGEPINVLVALSDDVLPEPGAIMVTGITPQKTRDEGYTEADFCNMFLSEVCTPGTIITGFNNVRFDDEFIRFCLYRNFRDPYEWCWLDGRSRWDLLDVVRLTRAIRPEGINWPTTNEGKPVNKLEPLAAANGLLHTKAHDALSDVEALIGLTQLIKEKQPKLFDYMLKLRDKKEVAKLVNAVDPQPFVYASGRYHGRSTHAATLAYPLAPHPVKSGCVLVYDLSFDPDEYIGATSKQLSESLFGAAVEGSSRVPVKELAYNKCPAVAPPGVLDEATRERLQIDFEEIEVRINKLRKNPSFSASIAEAFAMRQEFAPESDVDAKLYDGFFSGKDKSSIEAVRNASPEKLANFHPEFNDERLNELLLRYKARNYPKTLDASERGQWEEYRSKRIDAELPAFNAQLQRWKLGGMADPKKQFLLDELLLWAESIAPADF